MLIFQVQKFEHPSLRVVAIRFEVIWCFSWAMPKTNIFPQSDLQPFSVKIAAGIILYFYFVFMFKVRRQLFINWENVLICETVARGCGRSIRSQLLGKRDE